jgi:hypothetical protein
MRTILVIALALCACSATEKIEQTCQASLKDTLVNPETAKFFEFTPIKRAEAERLFYLGALKMRGTNESEVKYRYGTGTDQQFKDIANTAVSSYDAFHTYRVKAESRVGLKVTATYMCLSKEDECSCIDPENMG